MMQSEIPKFGNLQGVRVVSTGTNIAGPVACSLLAEQGADVIQIESTASHDIMRNIGELWTVEHRNNRTIALNIRSRQGEDILKKLVAGSDILVESSKGGTWTKWGLTDEVLWEINPRLVIAHVSGYGQSGDPEYVSRGSFDPIGQAFSGFLAVNGMPEPEPPLHAKPYTCDYVTALFAAWAVTAALYRAAQTGKGESIDIAQFEVMARIQADYLMGGLNKGIQPARMGIYGNAVCALPNVQRCQDGNYIMTGIGGVPVFRSLEKLLGLEGDPDFAEPHGTIDRDEHPRSDKIVSAMSRFCLSHAAAEANDILNERNIPCSVVMTYEMMRDHPHYQARETFTAWQDPVTGREVRGINTVPKFINNPGLIFRGGPTYGMDNEDILRELGYSDADTAGMYEAGVVKKA
ncbi:Bile acid-CoA transferase [bioreactor metagenome]|uniref:Bile acid-CoA transferase n=1 Tax=bioreactor metagenome TaxID=1076179 RepID=A0A644YQI8_9ZZZZ